jgi:Flp pilus assembly protein TadB
LGCPAALTYNTVSSRLLQSDHDKHHPAQQQQQVDAPVSAHPSQPSTRAKYCVASMQNRQAPRHRGLSRIVSIFNIVIVRVVSIFNIVIVRVVSIFSIVIVRVVWIVWIVRIARIASIVCAGCMPPIQ